MKVGLFSARSMLARIVSAVLEEDGHLLFSSRYWSVFEKGVRSGLFDLLIFDCPGVCPFSDIRCLALARSARVHTVVISPQQCSEMGERLRLCGLDVLTDPFYPHELLQLVRRISERLSSRPEAPRRPSPSPGPVLVPGEGMVELSPTMLLDRKSECLISDGLRIELSRREFRLLDALLRREGEVVDYDTLLTEIWGDGEKGSYDSLYVVVRSLRKKLGSRDGKEDIVQNKYGRGYMFKRTGAGERENCGIAETKVI
ncbi:MAG: winged helix-turn-helix domain-containing protein [Alicyclobacillaceae bacterium]|nr:winged helix-turn-helix domain-containing protein [Alicyclobacillaceae bacterium]